jgi:hypothetical protein
LPRKRTFLPEGIYVVLISYFNQLKKGNLSEEIELIVLVVFLMRGESTSKA